MLAAALIFTGAAITHLGGLLGESLDDIMHYLICVRSNSLLDHGANETAGKKIMLHSTTN